MQLGENIKRIRAKWGISQEELGLLVGASRGMIMQYETRGSTPKPVVFKEMSRVFDMTQDVLINHKLAEEEIPELSQQNWMHIQNYREDPDSFDIKNNDTVSFKSAAKRGDLLKTALEALIKSASVLENNTEYLQKQLDVALREVYSRDALIAKHITTTIKRKPGAGLFGYDKKDTSAPYPENVGKDKARGKNR